jgi:mRNA-degrading endonuclease RelE of RelBE toxin-antitoxin system
MVLMSEESTNIQILFSRTFKRQLRDLAKRYRQIQSDLIPVIQQIQTGELIGDRISSTGFLVIKVRIKNSDIKKGKSAGYRLIYHPFSSTDVLFLSIYSKSDISDITAEEVKEIIAEFYLVEQQYNYDNP